MNHLKYRKQLKKLETMEYALRWYFADVYWLNTIKEMNELSIDDIYTISRFWFSKKSWQSYKNKPDNIKINLYDWCKSKRKYIEETEKVKELIEYAIYFRKNYLEVFELFLEDFGMRGNVINERLEWDLPWPLELFYECFIDLDNLKDFSKIKDQNPYLFENHFRYCYENDKDITLKDYYKNIYKQ